MYPEVVTCVLAIISWLVIYPVFIFVWRIDPVNAAATVMLFDVLLAAYLLYRIIAKRERTFRHDKLKNSEDDKTKLADACEHAVRFESGIKAKEAEIVNLYEITKKMSECLKFEDIFREFSVFLKGNLIFRKCDLIILDHAGSEMRIDRVFSVWREGPPLNAPNAPAKTLRGEKLISLFSKGFKDVLLTRVRNPREFKELGIEDAGVETFVVLPLLSERKIVGMLSVENLPEADLERFVILAMQFALVIKKVLLYETVEKMAIADSLTGLYVRRYFYERVEEELQRSKKHKYEFAFIMIDIDDFKKYNDTYGHMVGDVIIKEIGRIIKEGVREIDIVSRYGGEEFAIALPETGEESARQVAERLRKKVEENVFKAYDEKLRLTISLGFAIYPRDAADIADILDKADKGLYEAKKSGKNVVCEYKT